MRPSASCRKCTSRNVFAGSGPLEGLLEGVPNIRNVGFQTGEELEMLIREARFSVYPSEWYENCPFSVMESQMYGTPVLGADIGGIPELIRAGETGELFESGNAEELKEKMQLLWGSYGDYICEDLDFMDIEQYFDQVESYYGNNIVFTCASEPCLEN